MDNNELYHYGVPGMRWGVRRAKKQLAKLTGRDKTKITDKQAEKFRGDVAEAKNIKSMSDRKAWTQTNAKRLGGKKYADAVLKQANKESISKFATKAAIGIGVGATAAIAFAPVGQILAGVNEAMWDFIQTR